MFKKNLNTEGESVNSVWGVSDPLKRQFLSGLFVGIAIGICLGRLFWGP